MQPENNQSWHNKTYSVSWLREKANSYYGYVLPWLRQIGVVPEGTIWNNVFSAYPLLDKHAIKGEHLASLAVEWDREGPCDLTNWLDMVEFECSGNPKRDIVVEALEAAGGISDRRSG